VTATASAAPGERDHLTAEPTNEYQAHRLGEADQERLG
jgi:hypothetical protein